MPIVPDDKDWTWVLERPCPECGLDSARIPREQVAGMVREVGPTWAHALHRSDVRTAPDAATWSILEYACHVRDALHIFDERLVLMLEEDDPVFANWDQDETAVADRYWEQNPATVAAELADAAAIVAASFAAVQADQWARRGRRSDGAEFTVESFARYFAHDPVHHLTADT